MLAVSPLCLTGRCTIAEVPAERDRLVEALAAGDGPLIVDLSSLEQADVTFVQLLVATRHEALSRHRPFAVAAWSPAAEDAFARAGLAAAPFAPLPALGA